MQEAKNIHQRINAIMADIDYIQKGQKTVNGQYRFVSHDQVTAALHPLLVKHGVNAIPSIEAIVQEGNRTSVNILVSFVNIDCPSDNFTVRFPGYGIDAADKGPGKAVSYAFKYAMLKTFNLETGDDPDEDQNARYEPEKCLDFDLMLPEHLTPADKKKLAAFLEYSAEASGKHVEDVKRKACERMAQFMTAFNNWEKKK